MGVLLVLDQKCDTMFLFPSRIKWKVKQESVFEISLLHQTLPL